MKVLIVEKRLGAGLFSGLNVILRAVYSLKKQGVDDIYVFWDNQNYGDEGENLFDKYIYRQNKISEPYEMVHAITLAQPLIHSDLEHELNAILNEYNFFSSDLYRKISEKSFYNPNNFLGVHVRYVNGHYNAPQPKDYFEVIEEQLDIVYSAGKTKSFFVASDHEMPLSAMKGKYEFPIYWNSVYRSPFFDFTDHKDWQFLISKEKLVLEAFSDVFSLSKCTHLIGSPSNMSSMAKIFAPDLKIIPLVPMTDDADLIKKGVAIYGKRDKYVEEKFKQNALNREQLLAKKKIVAV